MIISANRFVEMSEKTILGCKPIDFVVQRDTNCPSISILLKGNLGTIVLFTRTCRITYAKIPVLIGTIFHARSLRDGFLTGMAASYQI